MTSHVIFFFFHGQSINKRSFIHLTDVYRVSSKTEVWAHTQKDMIPDLKKLALA